MGKENVVGNVSLEKGIKQLFLSMWIFTVTMMTQ